MSDFEVVLYSLITIGVLAVFCFVTILTAWGITTLFEVIAKKIKRKKT